MRRVSFGFVIVMFLVASVGCINDEMKRTKTITQQKLSDRLKEKKENFYLVDVRTKEEYESGHIPGAINIPVKVIADTPLTEDKNACIVGYCRSGKRSVNYSQIWAVQI